MAVGRGTRSHARQRHARQRRSLTLPLGGVVAFCVVAVAVAVGLTQATGFPACAAAGLAAGGAVPAEALSTTSGEATHYVLQSGGGNCSYPGPPADQLYVALPPSQYGAASACGSYLDVTGPNGSVQVEVVNQCPECQTGHIDLSDQAFERIAPLAARPHPG